LVWIRGKNMAAIIIFGIVGLALFVSVVWNNYHGGK